MIQTRVSRFNRYWTCPVCSWRAYVSLRKHFQTGQPLTREQQIATLEYQASKHFKSLHRNDFTYGAGDTARTLMADLKPRIYKQDGYWWLLAANGNAVLGFPDWRSAVDWWCQNLRGGR